MGEFFVYNQRYAGRCFWSVKRGRVSSLFSYDSGYIAETGNWNIDPVFSFAEGAQPASGQLPGAFRDASPDRWGKNLIRHRFAQESGQGQARSLHEVDYLLGVSDRARQGDLRFSLTKGGVFQHPADDVPKLIALPQLLSAVRRYMLTNDESAVSYLLAAGSASLGGARPKASVLDGAKLMIAKFPHRQDDHDVMAWEWVALRLAAEAGMNTPGHRLVDIDGSHVVLLDRFDREPETGRRIGYISAMTLLGRDDGEEADYTEIAVKLRDVSVDAAGDLRELFRRVVFFLKINNTDDHLRNHGLIRQGSGWRLSPLFDINPNPDLKTLRATSVFGEKRRAPALAALIAQAGHFGLDGRNAAAIVAEVCGAVKSWQKYAAMAKVARQEMQYFQAVFAAED